MEFRIHFTKEGIEDDFTVKGETLEDIKKLANANLEIHNCDIEEANVWSEQIN